MATSDGGGSIVPYGSFTQYTPALPQFYWDVYSAEQRIKQICLEIDKIASYLTYLGNAVNDLVGTSDEIQKAWDELQTNLVPAFAEQIEAWLDANMPTIFEDKMRFTMFGIDAEGRYVAYVPENWSQIMFDWGGVYGRSDYLRIKLLFDAEGNAINNTYSYTLAQPTDLATLIADLEVTTSRSDVTYNTVFTNLDQEVTQDANQ